MDVLKRPFIYIKDEIAVLEKINKIKTEGLNKLQFVIDFDSTITKQHENGVPTLIGFEVFFRCKQLPLSSLETVVAIRDKNGAIELDPTIPIERKVEAMEEIYKVIHENLQGFEFDRKEIEQVVRKYGPSFRDSTKELFLKLKNLNIPVIVFSAGLGDIIKVHLKQEGVLYDNVSIIANFLKFDGNLLDGLNNHEQLIHPFNKHEHLNLSECTKASDNNGSIILMGDNIGDVTVVSDYEHKGTILKIGFFYNQNDDGLEIFKDTFDIVLDDDQTMNVILDVIKLLE